MQIERLRLVGFKSFVDATELAIEPGLTGIVGPNGDRLVEILEGVERLLLQPVDHAAAEIALRNCERVVGRLVVDDVDADPLLAQMLDATGEEPAFVVHLEHRDDAERP